MTPIGGNRHTSVRTEMLTIVSRCAPPYRRHFHTGRSCLAQLCRCLVNAHELRRQTAAPDLFDTALAYMAEAALARHHSLPPGAVRASAMAGWLTLTGVVSWHQQRQDAAACVSDLPGLAGISINITLHPSATASLSAFR